MRAQILALTVSTLAFPASATTLSSLTSWSGTTGYVFGPAMVAAATGDLFGVLGYGSSTPSGSVYQLSNAGGTWTQTTISSFSGGSSGGSPAGGLMQSSAGDLYGAAFGGGSSSSTCKSAGLTGCGLIYQLAPPTSGNTWTRTVLYTFAGGTDGIGPVGGLISDSTGALYGVTANGGCTPTLSYPVGCGIVFKLTPPGAGKTAWTETVLYRFQGGSSDGAYPMAPLAMDAAGNLYGATEYGGTENCTTLSGTPDGRCGTVFKLTNSSGTYTESILHIFTDGTDGSIAGGGVVLDKTGNVYGTALQGGTASGLCLNFGYSGCGQVFELAKPKSGTVWKKTALLNFSGKDGATPAGLMIDSKGRLYGVTSHNTTADSSCGVSYYCGTVFKLAKIDKVWTEAVLYNFTGSSSIADPEFGLAVDASGNVYGVTEYNVTSTVFMMTGSGFTPPLRK
jgi:hypothetical protein